MVAPRYVADVLEDCGGAEDKGQAERLRVGVVGGGDGGREGDNVGLGL